MGHPHHTGEYSMRKSCARGVERRTDKYYQLLYWFMPKGNRDILEGTQERWTRSRNKKLELYGSILQEMHKGSTQACVSVVTCEKEMVREKALGL